MLGSLIANVAMTATADQQLIRNELIQACTAFIAGDAKALIAFYLPSVMIFDVHPRQKDFATVQKLTRRSSA